MPENKFHGLLSAGIIILFAVTALTYSLTLPAWVNSDEPYHYYYVESLAKQHQLPSVEDNYEAVQPPLYYIAAAAWSYLFIDSSDAVRNKWLRVLSALMGTATIFFLYRIGADCFESPSIGLGLAALAYSTPAFVIINSVLNNDPATVFMVTATIYYIIRTIKRGIGPSGAAICGLLAGLCCLTKLSAVLLPVFFVALYCLKPANRARGIFPMFKDIVIFGMFFVAVSAWWYIRLYLMSESSPFFDSQFVTKPNPLYVPAHLVWFAKSMMLNFWLPNDYLRGYPQQIPYVLKLAYTAFSGLLGALAVYGFAISRKKTPAWAGRIMLGFLLCIIVFFLQQSLLNMTIQTAQARYFYPFLCTIGIPALFAIKDILKKEGVFEKTVFAVLLLSVIHHCVWLFVFIKTIPEMLFQV